MKIRNEWMTDYEYFEGDYPNNLLLDNAKKRFELQRDDSLEGKDAFVDGASERIVVKTIVDPLVQNRNYYERKVGFNESSNVKTGSIVEFDNKKWIVISSVSDKQAYKVGSVVECNLLPFYYKIGNNVFTTYGVYQKNVYTNEENQPINLPNDVVVVSIPLDINSNKIKKGNYFYLFGDEWYERYEVEGLDRSRKDSTKKLLVIRAKESQSDVKPEDFYDLNPISETQVGSVIVTPSTLSMNINTTQQFTASVYDKSGILMPDELVTWSSSATTIATVSVSGLVTAKTVVGSCEIIAKSVTDDDIVGKCTLEVIEDSGGWW